MLNKRAPAFWGLASVCVEKAAIDHSAGEMELHNSKLRTLEEAVARAVRLKEEGRKVVLTNGIFDLLHTGHLYYLRKAAELGDALFVALNSDESTRALKGPERPILDEAQRAYALGVLEFVDTGFYFSGRSFDEGDRETQAGCVYEGGRLHLGDFESGGTGGAGEVWLGDRFHAVPGGFQHHEADRADSAGGGDLI